MTATAYITRKMLFNCLALGNLSIDLERKWVLFSKLKHLKSSREGKYVLFRLLLLRKRTNNDLQCFPVFLVVVVVLSNEGFYTMRMLEPNTASNAPVVSGPPAPTSLTSNTAGAMLQSAAATMPGATMPGDRLDASSDSAVSSMGSERVPSLSDSEWGDGGSDSAQEYHQR